MRDSMILFTHNGKDFSPRPVFSLAAMNTFIEILFWGKFGPCCRGMLGRGPNVPHLAFFMLKISEAIFFLW